MEKNGLHGHVAKTYTVASYYQTNKTSQGKRKQVTIYPSSVAGFLLKSTYGHAFLLQAQ